MKIELELSEETLEKLRQYQRQNEALLRKKDRLTELEPLVEEYNDLRNELKWLPNSAARNSVYRAVLTEVEAQVSALLGSAEEEE